jgi:O-antigen biosynthesis protein
MWPPICYWGYVLNICVVTKDIVGPILNGGIGTAYTNLCQALADEGHRVTILYALGDYSESLSIREWIKRYSEWGIDFMPLPPPENPIIGDGEVCRSFKVYQWLKQNSFDVIHFPELGGLGYYSLLAKNQNLAFSKTEIWVGIHGPTFWHFHFNKEFPSSVTDLCIDHMERSSVELADKVISPSEFMVDWMKRHHWKLPPDTRIIQNVFHPKKQQLRRPAFMKNFSELVFFGRLENRKGLEIFCDAVSRIGRLLESRSVKVTFLGKSVLRGDFDSAVYIRSRSSEWSVETLYCGNLGTDEALEYLCQKNVLAVIPSLSENSPYSVLECLALGIPCIASNVGGISELVHPDDHATCLFKPNAEALVERITAILGPSSRSFKPGRLKNPTEETISLWVDIHAEVEIEKIKVEPEPLPSLSVCIVHRNRPKFLERCLASIEKQENVDYELILVDDGSDTPEAQELLTRLELDFAKRGWLILRQSRLYPGAARNLAAKNAKGEYLFFMDDDNVAEPNELECFLKAAQASKSDILTCAFYVFDEEEITSEPFPEKRGTPINLFLGGAPAAGLYTNVYGDTNSLIRREVFLELGGFSEDYGVGYEDWEFFAKAALQGHKIQTVPEPLFWYRRSQTGVNNHTDRYANRLRALRPYLEFTAFPLAPALLLASALFENRDPNSRHSDPRNGRGWDYVLTEDLLFESSDCVTLKCLDSETGFSTVGVYNIGRVDYSPILKFESLNDDPIVLLPPVYVPNDHFMLCRVHMRVSVISEVEMFFTTEESLQYSEHNRLRKRVPSGEQIVTFSFPPSARGDLRLDPGSHAGWYEIRRIEIRAIPTESQNFFRLPNRNIPGCNAER